MLVGGIVTPAISVLGCGNITMVKSVLGNISLATGTGRGWLDRAPASGEGERVCLLAIHPSYQLRVL